MGQTDDTTCQRKERETTDCLHGALRGSVVYQRITLLRGKHSSMLDRLDSRPQRTYLPVFDFTHTVSMPIFRHPISALLIRPFRLSQLRFLGSMHC